MRILRLRACLFEPIDAIFHAAKDLSDAVDAHLAGDSYAAGKLIARANDPAIWAHTDFAWGKEGSRKLALRRDPCEPPAMPIAGRPIPRMPTRLVREQILLRDGYYCRFCGIPVISSLVRQQLHALYSAELPWGRANHDQHAAFQCMWLQFDHLLPNSRGGTSGIENVVVTCAPCNFGRMEFTLKEAGLESPLSRPTAVRWEGLPLGMDLNGFKEGAC